MKTKITDVVTYCVLAMLFVLMIALLLERVFRPDTSDNNLLIMVAQAVIGMCTMITSKYFRDDAARRKEDSNPATTKGEANEKTN